jgi:sodium-dependent dicarboxylate transporter 2/3/5
MKGEKMFLKSKWCQLGVAVVLCLVVLLLPRPEGTRFTIKGDDNQVFLQHIKDKFNLVNSVNSSTDEYMVEVKSPENFKSPGIYLREKAEELKLKDLRIDYGSGSVKVLVNFILFTICDVWVSSFLNSADTILSYC